jgi:hypothetical protein
MVASGQYQVIIKTVPNEGKREKERYQQLYPNLKSWENSEPDKSNVLINKQ